MLRTLPPDRAADEIYGRGTTWQEEMERRRRSRRAGLMLYLEDRPPHLLLTDAPPGAMEVVEPTVYVCPRTHYLPCVPAMAMDACINAHNVYVYWLMYVRMDVHVHVHL